MAFLSKVRLLIVGLVVSSSLAGAEMPLDQIRLPAGFQISLYASPVPNAREMTWGDQGTLFVSTRSEGNVYAIVDGGAQRRVITIARGLQNPNGVAFRKGSLYVAERSRILRYDDIEKRLNDPPKPVVVRDDFPTHPHHGWKFIAFGPDDQLYVPVGAPCNNCVSPDPIFASITRLSPDGKTRDIVAHGVRNTVGFDWDPKTRELWFTDNGRDELGDDIPPDELNHATKNGLDFGYPYCHGQNISDPEFGKDRLCAQTVPPAISLAPHVAALGMRFYTGKQFPPEYQGDIFIAEHGSWNRRMPVGYRVTRVHMKDGKPASYTVFARGWLPETAKPENPQQPNTLRADESAGSLPRYEGPAKVSQAWGRPVDVLVTKDGSLLVSDDEAGCIYRITYTGKSR